MKKFDIILHNKELLLISTLLLIGAFIRFYHLDSYGLSHDKIFSAMFTDPRISYPLQHSAFRETAADMVGLQHRIC